MVLVDTSVWIEFINGNSKGPVEYLKYILSEDQPVGITGLIYQEILQGADSLKRYRQFRDYFGSQIFFHPNDPIESYAAAARLYFDCRRKGVTIRSTNDCLIAQIAIEHDLGLLHNDRDFEQMKAVIPALKFAYIR